MSAKRAMSMLAVLSLAGQSAAATPDLRLVEAAKRSDHKAVRSLLKERVDVNASEADGTTALHWAAQRGDLETADLLVQAGAHVNAANRLGATPLFLACVIGDGPMVVALLTAGADARFAMPEGQTALMTAARTGSEAAVKALLAHGADANAKEGWHGQTALMWAAAENHTEVVKPLIEGGAEVNAKSTVAVSNVGSETTNGGFSALMFAVRAGHIDCVRVLLDAGANVNDTLPGGTSALVLATMNARYELAALLLDKGADPNADVQGWTALHQLVWTRNPNHHYNLPPPQPTGSLDSMGLAKALLDHGANVNAQMTKEPRDGYRQWMKRIGATPFVMAAKAADLPLMRLLLARGADPSITAKDGTNALMAAAGIGYWSGDSPGTEAEALEAVKTAFDLGNGVNVINDDGYTSMHGAATRGANSIVQFLYSKGAKLDVKSKKDGWLPLTIADGVLISGTWKDEAHTAVLLRQLMAAEGLAVPPPPPHGKQVTAAPQ